MHTPHDAKPEGAAPSAAPMRYTREDFTHSPLLVFYELTRACDLACKHCRASAQPHSHPQELTSEQSKQLLSQLTQFPKPPMVVLTGGDPMKRPDLFELVRHGVECGLHLALSPSVTPLLTLDALKHMRQAGVQRISISFDGADAPTHDAFRGIEGSFARTLEALEHCKQVGMSVQVNTTLARHNLAQIDTMASLLANLEVAMWSVFFLIPVGRGRSAQRMSPTEYEAAFSKLFAHSQRQPYAVKTTEAPHYRRFVLQQQGLPPNSPKIQLAGRLRPVLLGTNDGKGVIFISHTGHIYPSGFMPLLCGTFPADSIVETYQKAPLLKSLRDPDNLKGKCGRCEYRHICGGSRARAYALTQDPLAPEPDCSYIPKRQE